MGAGGILKWGLDQVLNTELIRDKILKRLDIYDEVTYFTNLISKVTNFTLDIQYYALVVQIIFGLIYAVFLWVFFFDIQFEEFNFIKKWISFYVVSFSTVALDAYISNLTF